MKNAWAKLRERYSDHIDIAEKLHVAIIKDDVDAIKKIVFKYFSAPDTAPLLNGNIVVSSKGDDVFSYPPAIFALLCSNHNALKAILEITCNPNVRENPDDPEHSPTLLIKAVTYSDIEMVKLILDAGADPNQEYTDIRDESQAGFSRDAFQFSVSQDLQKTSFLLLERGVIPSFYAAVIAIHNDSDGNQQNLERMIALRPELVNKQLLGGTETSLLNQAILFGKVSSVRWLIEQGADFNMAIGGLTPLDLAVHAEKKEIAAFLQSVGGVSGERDETPALQASPATKQEITKSIERLELLEEKFGIAISGLYASYEYDAEYAYPHRVRINFDLISLNGGQLERNFKLIASAYNSAGQLLGTDNTYINADDFMGFSPTSITLALDQMPEKIRLFPANP